MDRTTTWVRAAGPLEQPGADVMLACMCCYMTMLEWMAGKGTKTTMPTRTQRPWEMIPTAKVDPMVLHITDDVECRFINKGPKNLHSNIVIGPGRATRDWGRVIAELDLSVILHLSLTDEPL